MGGGSSKARQQQQRQVDLAGQYGRTRDQLGDALSARFAEISKGRSASDWTSGRLDAAVEQAITDIYNQIAAGKSTRVRKEILADLRFEAQGMKQRARG